MSIELIKNQKLAERLRALPIEASGEDRLPQVLAALAYPASSSSTIPLSPIPISSSQFTLVRASWALACGCGLAAWLFMPQSIFTPRGILTPQGISNIEPKVEDSQPDGLERLDLLALMARSQRAEHSFYAARQATRMTLADFRQQQMAKLAVQSLDQQLLEHAMDVPKPESNQQQLRTLWQERVSTLENANHGQLNAQVLYVD